MSLPTLGPVALTPPLLEEARGWILDCHWRNRDTCPWDWDESLTDSDVVAIVARYYDGGLPAFRMAS